MWDVTIEDILYRSGDVFLPKQVKTLLDSPLYSCQSDTYYFYINAWTFTHMLSGLLIGYIFLHIGRVHNGYYYIMFATHTIWETWQVIIGMSKPFSMTGVNNIIDTIVDTLAFLCGAYIATFTK
jgi:hypothetical protein